MTLPYHNFGKLMSDLVNTGGAGALGTGIFGNELITKFRVLLYCSK